MLNGKRVQSFLTRAVLLGIVFAAAACGGGTTGSIEPDPIAQTIPVVADPAVGGRIKLHTIRTASGAPAGVQVSWTRVNDAECSGYYIYRDTSSIPAGDPTGHEALRINGGNKIDQSGSGTQTLTFNDSFSPAFGDTYYYRMTVVNQTSDESDFSGQQSITIAEHTITSVSQTGGSIGDNVTIVGTHFGDARNGDTVQFTNSSGDTTVNCAAGDYVSWSMTQIVVKIPYGAADGEVGVTITGAQVISTDTINYSEPSITSLNPTQDYVQNQYITLAGADFGPPPSSGGSDTQVYFGTYQAQSGDIDEAQWTTSQIKVKVPSAAVGGTVNVKVVLAGNNSNLKPFLILPHLNSISPTSGVTGTSVTATGTNFGATQGAGTVRVKGFLASVTSWSNTSVTFTVPAQATDGNVVVMRDDTQQTNGIGFDVVPTLTGFSPVRRVIGEELTITGTGFGSSRGTSTVKFINGNAVASSYTSWSQTQIVVVVPAGSKTGHFEVDIADNSVGSNQDSVESGSDVKVILAPPNINGVGQL